MQERGLLNNGTATDGSGRSMAASPAGHSRVLIVDNEPRVLRALKAALKSRFNISLATSADEAKALLLKSGPYDVIVSDERMPRCSGLELFQWTKSNYPHAARVLLSSTDLESKREQIRSAEVYRCISKPWDTKEFAEILDRAARLSMQRKRRLSDGGKLFAPEQRSSQKRPCSMVVVDPDKKYWDIYKQFIREAGEELVDIFCFSTSNGLESNLPDTAIDIGIFVLDLSIGEDLIVDIVNDLSKRSSSSKVIITAEPALLLGFALRVKKHRVNAFIPKPLSAQRIQPVVKRVLQSRHGNRNL